jgi:penicillin amidase
MLLRQRRAHLLFAALFTTACSPLEPKEKPGLPAADVQIITDDLGFSHVYAQSDADAFFGAGYAMARDRLFQMELTRRQAYGTTAEIFGQDHVARDVGARTFDFRGRGKADLDRLRKERPEEIPLFEAWAAGVNQRIAEVKSGAAPRPYGLGSGPDELDFVPDPWSAEDAFIVGKLLATGLSSTLDYEILASAILRLAPNAAKSVPLLLPTYDVWTTVTTSTPPSPAPPPPVPPPSFSGTPKLPKGFSLATMVDPLGSNNWAVDAAHSTNGRPLLAGDPHQPLTSPSRFWPVHLSSVAGGGTLDVAGFSFVGTPLVELGHNAHIGWTATTNYADVMDLWDVEIAQDYSTVSLGGVDRPLTTRAEIINVRKEGAPFGESDPMTVSIHESPGYGVILPDEMLPLPRSFLADHYILFNWTGFAPTLEASAYLAMDRADSVDAFESAVDRIEVGAANFVSADQHDISLHVHGTIPDRGDPASHPMPWRILPGGDAASLWDKGTLPPSKIPHLKNPERGFISTANNDPFGFTADGNVENDPYYYGAFYANGMRAYRIQDALEKLLMKGPVDRAAMEELQADTHSVMADTLLPKVADAIAAIDTDPALSMYEGRDDLKQIAARLAAWDRRFDRDAAEPAIFEALEWFCAQQLFEALFTPPLFDAIGDKSPPFFLGMLRNVIEKRFAGADALVPDQRLLFLAGLDATATWMKARFGSLDASFTRADVHAAEFVSDFGGKLTVPPVPVDGSADTINVSPAGFFKSGTPRDQAISHEASLYRMVVGFGDDGVPEATVDFARGASGEPDSAHFADQQDPWVAVAHPKLAFRRPDVDARTTALITLPAGIAK